MRENGWLHEKKGKAVRDTCSPIADGAGKIDTFQVHNGLLQPYEGIRPKSPGGLPPVVYRETVQKQLAAKVKWLAVNSNHTE